MSRIGNKPVELPKGVTAAVEGSTVKGKGPQGELAVAIPEGIVVFSSDFPHVEGHQEAVALYDAQLAGVSAGAREAFFGRSAAALMGI